MALGVLNVVVWIVRTAAMAVGLRRRLVLTSTSHASPSSEAPRLTVLVAAKDEEVNIETCVRGLLAQDYPELEIVVIDDRSRDATPRILERLSAEAGGRLTVRTVTELPGGWYGKNHAMHVGMREATGAWLLFTDADCRFLSPRALSVAVREARLHDVDFLCLTPLLDMPSRWERMIQPVCSMVLILWFLPHRVNDPRRRTAYANGAFMLVRRSCYEAIGGHAAVRQAMNEDIQLARRAKASGLRLRVMENADLYSTRMYRTFGELCRGWARIFRGCLETVPKLGTSLVLIVTFTILPCVSLAVALAGRWRCAAEEALRWNAALALWGASVFMLLALMTLYYRMLRLPVRWAPTYALGAVVAAGILIRAIRDTWTARAVRWRGTEYRDAAMHRFSASAKGDGSSAH